MPLPKIEPLDLQEIRTPFSDPEWLFEIKYDGFRALALIEGGECRLVSRNDRNYKRFLDLRRALPGNIAAKDAILDGELVVLDREGKSQFNELMFNRAQPIFAAFDLLWRNGVDLRDRELLERKALLRRLVKPDAQHALYVGHIVEQGEALYRQACERDVEGIVAKPIISPYHEVAGRSPWLKIRNPSYSQNKDRGDLFNRKPAK